MVHKDVYGLVLAGGRSVRMGTDKGLLDYKGKPQREYLFDLLSNVCEQVFTSCRAEQNVPVFLHPIVDNFDYEGPINGILTGIQTHPEKAWLVIAVDMPFVDLGALEFLLANRDKSKLATCFLNEAENFPEPLLTVWEPTAYAQLKAYAAAGNISPRMFLESNPIKTVKPADKKVLLNINYPKDIGRLFE
jgi:molybdopterin-guanine dinucleotide biosynthesis protein A